MTSTTTTTQPKRIAYHVTLRCTLTGADWSRLIFAFDCDHAEQRTRAGFKRDPRYYDANTRLLRCRRASPVEVDAHRLRMSLL